MLRYGKLYKKLITILILILVIGIQARPAQSIGSKLPDVSLVSSTEYSCGSILFSDDFNDGNGDGWTTSGDGTWVVDNNQYGVDMGMGDNLRGISLAGNTNWTDYIYELDLLAESGIDKVILYRYVDEDNLYSTAIVGTYNFANLVKVENGVASTLLSVDYPHDNYEWHHVKTTVLGNHISVYVDGDLVIDYADSGSSLTHGEVGLQGWTGLWGSNIVRFDNVIVRQLCMVYLPLVISE